MNAKRIGLTSLAILLTLGGLIASASAQATCVPTTGGPYCPISGQASFQATYIGTQQNAIASAGYLSDFGTFVAANLTSLFVLAIVLVVVFMVWDRFYRK